MLISKVFVLGASSLMSLALAAISPGPRDDPPPHHKAKQKEGHKPGGELKKTYDLLRHLQAGARTPGRSEDRLKEWTERSVKYYREAVEASEGGDERKSHELGLAAHDLARAVDHARNAASFDPDNDLPPPPDAGGPEGEDERNLRDLKHAHDRISELRDRNDPDTKFYFTTSKDLYNAAQRDAVAGRRDRAGELARAAEALTHVPEHLAKASEEKPEPKEKRDRPEPPKGKRDHPEAKAKHDRPEARDAIPPPIN